MTTVMERTDQEYNDMAYAIRCIENGDALRIRKSAGISQTALGARVGVQQVYIHRWERDVVRPNLQNLNALAAYGRELRKLSAGTNN